MVVAITLVGHGSGAALAPASTFPARTGGPAECSAGKCLRSKALPPVWVLPPARRQDGRLGEDGQRRALDLVPEHTTSRIKRVASQICAGQYADGWAVE